MEYRCGHCGKTKPESDFMPSQRKTGSWCTACHRDRYGKKAPHPSRPCEHCGTEMVDPNPKARFCGQTCKTGFRLAAARADFVARTAMRQCEACGVSLEGRRTDTRWCSETCGARKRPNRKSVARRAMLKSNYGLSVAEYEAHVKKQRGMCAICKSSDPKHRSGAWAVDHDHVTGRVRGLLCSRCNTGIGQLQDDPAIIAAALAYVRKHRQLVLAPKT